MAQAIRLFGFKVNDFNTLICSIGPVGNQANLPGIPVKPNFKSDFEKVPTIQPRGDEMRTHTFFLVPPNQNKKKFIL
jgi:hypothetical protein